MKNKLETDIDPKVLKDCFYKSLLFATWELLTDRCELSVDSKPSESL